MSIVKKDGKIIVKLPSRTVVIFEATAAGLSKEDFLEKHGFNLGETANKVYSMLPKAEAGPAPKEKKKTKKKAKAK